MQRRENTGGGSFSTAENKSRTLKPVKEQQVNSSMPEAAH